jgi:hypothetical protein
LRLDKAWGVLYAEEFPQGDLDLKPDTTILYTNEKSWRKDQGVEMEYCYKINELVHQKALKDAEKDFEKSVLGQLMKEPNIGIDDPALTGAPDLLQDPLSP